MRFISYLHDGEPGWGAVDGGNIVDLTRHEPTLQTAISKGTLPVSLDGVPAQKTVALDEAVYLPPIPGPRRILCIGQNYVAHRAEMGGATTAHPLIFTRYPSSVSGHERELVKPRESDHYDFEGELAVIIGRTGRRIPPDRALEHIAGYSCFMDGTIRDYQVHTTQYIPGKNFDGSGSCGPWMVPAAEIPDPNAGYRLETRLNGNTVQSTTTDLMIFSIPVLLAYLSTFTTLEPGDIIATGTPGGVGYKREPQLYMSPGDRIEVELEGIGILSNTITGD